MFTQGGFHTEVLRRKNEQSIYQIIKMPKIFEEIYVHIATEHLSIIKKLSDLVYIHILSEHVSDE
jgi:hypothetical protein